MKMKIKGHETFTIREGWLEKGLAEVNKNPKVFTKNYGADALGVGSNMAKSIRYWLKAGEFAEEVQKVGAELTDIGEIIYEKDPYLEDIFSLWIFHINLAWNKEYATSWYMFFNEINIEDFSKEELVGQLMEKLQTVYGVESVPERSVRDDVSALINMYVKERIEEYDPEEKKISPFTKLGLIKKGIAGYQKAQPSSSDLSDMAVFYAMQRYMKEKEKDSAGIDELLNAPLSPGKILNLNRLAINEYIDNLAMKELVTVNRTAGLDMVYMRNEMSLQVIVEDYYK